MPPRRCEVMNWLLFPAAQSYLGMAAAAVAAAFFTGSALKDRRGGPVRGWIRRPSAPLSATLRPWPRRRDGNDAHAHISFTPSLQHKEASGIRDGAMGAHARGIASPGLRNFPDKGIVCNSCLSVTCAKGALRQRRAAQSQIMAILHSVGTVRLVRAEPSRRAA